MFQVVKRDGEIAEFQMSKITAAIDKAFDAKEKVYSKDMIDLMALRVTADFQNKITDGKVTVGRYSGQCRECSDPGRFTVMWQRLISFTASREKRSVT